MDRSKNEKTVDAHTMHTDSLKSTARSSKLKGADMRGIQKIKNKDGTYSYRAQVRLNDGIPQQSKSFPSLVEARTWKAQEETKRRQGMYFPSMTSKQTKLDELIDRYITKVDVFCCPLKSGEFHRLYLTALEMKYHFLSYVKDILSLILESF